MNRLAKVSLCLDQDTRGHEFTQSFVLNMAVENVLVGHVDCVWIDGYSIRDRKVL